MQTTCLKITVNYTVMAEEGSGGRHSFILNLAKASVAVPKGKELRAAQAHSDTRTHCLSCFLGELYLLTSFLSVRGTTLNWMELFCGWVLDQMLGAAE